jgi:twitching motility protein PilT
MNINTFLLNAVKKKASDVHLISGVAPAIRINQRLVFLDLPPLKEDETMAMARQVLNGDGDKLKLFEQNGEIDVSYCITDIGYFRVNCYRQRGTVGIAVRVINSTIPTIESLELPDLVYRLARQTKGLILVTGPTGIGKSTTLAAIIDLINRERACHIITLEDPIEYKHVNKKCIITQREIGRDSKSFPDALRAALRQDPDVIMVGEMRDLETISIAITAAETGHLVLATLHTINSAQTIERIIDAFEPAHQQQIRIQLANTLVGILSQRLIPRKDGSGLIAAIECLTSNPAVRNLIREGKAHQLYSMVETGSRFGMIMMDKHLQSLYDKGMISSDTLKENATDLERINEYLNKNNTSDHPNMNRAGKLK